MSSLHLLQLTDLHLKGSEDGAVRGVATLPALEATLASARARRWPPDAVLLTGDLVQDDPGGYAHVRRLLGGLGLPILCIPGNHDDPRALRRELGSAPFILDRHVDLGRWRIVQLDSSSPDQASGHLPPEELAGLEEALATAGERHCLVCLHHHPVPMGSQWLDTVGLDNAAQLLAVLDRHRPVRALVWGHVHQCYEGQRHGVRLLATPSTCVQFLPGSEAFAVDQRPPGYRTLTAQADGSLQTEVVWLETRTAGSSRSACSAA